MKALYLLLMVSFSSSLCFSQDGPIPENALSSYEGYLESIRNISFHSQFRDRVAEKSDDFTNALSQEWKIDFQEKRLWGTTRKTIANPKTESDKVRVSQYNESLVTPNANYQISVNADTATVIGFTSYLNTPEDYWGRLTGVGYLSYPFGYLKDGREYKYIPDLIRKASQRIASERGKPLSRVVLSCKTEEYALNIRLDPSKGWMADRIEFTSAVSTTEDVRRDCCLYTVEHSSKRGCVWLPDLYQCKVSRRAEKHKLSGNARIIDGKLVIVKGGAELGTDAIEQPQSTLIAEVTLSDIDMSPLRDSDFEIQTAIPDGTKVSMQDAQHLDFMWLDGEVVPVTDQSLKALRGSRFLGGPGSSRFWAVILGVFLLAIILYLKIRDWRKVRRL